METAGDTKNPKVLVIGCFHGDEPQGKYLIDEYLKDNKNTKLLFIPCLNEYGVRNNVRTNENGVDLNRNFPTGNWELTERNEFFGGEFPESEKETKFVISVVEKYNPKIILTLHAPFKVVNYDGDAEALAEEISQIINYPVEGNIGYPNPGSFGTWAGVERNIPTITLELDEEVEVESLKESVFKIFKLLENK